MKIVTQSYHNTHGQPAETEMIYSTANYSTFFKEQKVITPSVSGISVPRYFKIFIDDEQILRYHFRADNHADSIWLQQPSPSRELTSLSKLADAANNYASFPASSFRLSGTEADDAHGSGTSATPVRNSIKHKNFCHQFLSSIYIYI
jgi:hypothetical protein